MCAAPLETSAWGVKDAEQPSKQVCGVKEIDLPWNHTITGSRASGVVPGGKLTCRVVRPSVHGVLNRKGIIVN